MTRQIGPFKILSVIGEGGMGVVYLAEQEKPVRRRVALKLIKPGMDSKAVLARFEAERQALALMNHPAIAKVFEAGTTEHGQPFFAMEHVKGISLTDYCDRQRLSLKERLRLFVEVCHGVQHAHQKAVIHRDLKPSNILVAEDEGRPVPKIIDFGLAKALGGQQLTEMSLYTEQGVLVGTPEYMSPEQVDPTALDVDTRTDIYSLGVILYQILTSTLPFDTEDLRRAAQVAAMLSIRKRICEEQPQKPSTRVSSSANVAAIAAQKSKLDPGTLTRRLRGDLDWITMQALEKDRARRYATATDLAADIERHLNHEPVSAGPPGVAYKLKKLVRKNAGLVTSVLSLFLLLLAGGVTSTFLWVKAEAAKRDALEAKSREAEQRAQAEGARNLAQAREREAIAARHESDRQRNEVLRLADVKRLQELLVEADGLWPAHSDRIGDLENWQRRAERLVANLDAHRSSLAALRKLAIEEAVPPEQPEWRFADTESLWRHDVLTELVTDLETFIDLDPRVGTIASVEKRLAFARTVRKETIEKYEVEWQEAVASIRDDYPQSNGLEIEPQLGLVPIGRDPDSGLWEFGHIQTGEIPDRDDDGKLILTDGTGIVFVLIPGGTFRMGAQKSDPEKPNYDADADGNEAPVHEITLEPFFLSKYEMTQGQWARFVGRNPSRFGAHDYDANWDRTSARRRRRLMGLHPVEHVSWEDCTDVTSRMDLLLPTEAQWEYAARAGTRTVYFTGDEVVSLDTAANLADAYSRANGGPSGWVYEEELDDGYNVHAPIGRFRANRFGLHDVVGNVWEWCRDGAGSYTLPVKPADGERLVPSAGECVSRGGGFSSTAVNARSTFRYDLTPGSRSSTLGVRVSRVITE